MKLKNWLSCFALAAFAMGTASCSNDDDEVMVDKTPRDLKIEVGINSTAAGSRAGIVGTKFSNDESLGLYIYTGAGLNGDYAQVAGHKSKNSKYTWSAEGWFADDIDQGIVLSEVVGTLYAYYPYSATNDAQAGDAIPVVLNAAQGSGLSDGTKDVAEQTDYMWADKVGNVSNTTTTTTLKMNHAFSMLSFKFIKGDYPGAGVVNSIKVINNNGKEFIRTGNATMNISDGTLTLAGDATSAVGVMVSPEKALGQEKDHNFTNEQVAKMLVYPTVATKGEAEDDTFTQGDVRVVITLDGKEYKFDLPAAANEETTKATNHYLAGYNYEYTFNLKGKVFGGNDGGESWKDDVKVEIKDWITVPSGSGDMVSPEENV